MTNIEKIVDVNDSDMKALVDALKDNKATASHELASIAQKIDLLPAQFDSIRREQRDSIDALRRELGSRMEEQRRELLNYFVPRAEFDPRYKVVLDKIAEYDKMIADSRQESARYYGFVKDVEQNKADIAQLQDKGNTTFTRSVAIIATIISILSVLVTLASHFQFH